MFKVGINFDEISSDLDEALKVMKSCGVHDGELRTVGGKNFVYWTDAEAAEFKSKIKANGITLVAAATPLFKWYTSPTDPEVVHDSFGFNPWLDDNEKRRIIGRTIELADQLNIPRLRIFSGLGQAESAGKHFAVDRLLGEALHLAASANIDLYIENEPVCRVHTRADIVELLFAQPHKNLKLWLDIANIYEIGESVDEAFLDQVSSRLGYVHVKDYVGDGRDHDYVPVGDGVLDYRLILGLVGRYARPDAVITVETHAKNHKVDASRRSLIATKKIVESLA